MTEECYTLKKKDRETYHQGITLVIYRKINKV
jgi:hypothetical protein